MDKVIDWVVRCLATYGAVMLLLSMLGILWIWKASRSEEEESERCSCLEVPGDDPNCPVHAQLAASYDRVTSRMPTPTNFEKTLERRMQIWSRRQ